MSTPQASPPLGQEAFFVLQQFYEYDRDIPLDARVLQCDEQEMGRREKLVFRGRHGRPVPAYVTLPRHGSPPYPCAMLAHGMSGSKDDWSDLQSVEAGIAQGLLSAGLALMALDGPCQGERTVECDYESIYTYIRPNRYREVIVDWTIEHRMAMDYLASRPEVDSARIGIFGYSLGGVMAYCLLGVDARIKAAVIASTAPLTLHYLQGIGWDETALLRMAPIAPQTFAPAIKSTPVLMLNGNEDPYGTVESIQRLFESLGSPTKELAFLDCGHRLPAEHVPIAVAWFQRYLQ